MIFTPKYDTRDYFRGMFYFDIKKMKLQSKIYEISKSTEITEKDLHLLTINMFLFQTLINNNLFKSNLIIILSNVLQIIKKRMFDSFVFLPLSTRAYFKGRPYIKIILKNQARCYFAGGSFYRGKTVLISAAQRLLRVI